MLGEIRRGAAQVRYNATHSAPTSFEDTLIPLLARRSYHIPGNTWVADWCQWFCNNHILFGICFHNRLHPLEWWERTLALAASISFGLVATNIVYVSYQYNRDYMNHELYTLNIFNNEYSLTYGVVLLWTLGGICHSIFDMIIWNIMACACCHPGGKCYSNSFNMCCCNINNRCKDCGSYMLIPLILVILIMAIFFVLKRAAGIQDHNNGEDDNDNENANDQDGGDADDFYNFDVENIHGIESFHFLAKYSIELLLAWLVYFPIVGTILFSGILGCNGRLPILGGRPRDIKLIEKQREEARNGGSGAGYLGF